MGPEEQLIDFLRQNKVLPQSSLDEALARQTIFGGKLVTHLLERPELEAGNLLKHLAMAWNYHSQDPGPLLFSLEKSVALLSEDLLAVVQEGQEQLYVIVSHPLSETEQLRLQELVGPYQISLALPQQLNEAVNHLEVFSTEQESRSKTPGLAVKTNAASSKTEVNVFHKAEVKSIVAPGTAEHQPWEDHAATAPPPRDYALLAEAPAPKSLAVESCQTALPQISIDLIKEKLKAADDRSEIADVLLKFTGSIFNFSALFAVTSDELKGLHAVGSNHTDISSIRFPLDLKSNIQKVCEMKQYRILRLKASGLEGGLYRDLNRPCGHTIFLWPIQLRHRVVLLLWGDQGQSDVDISQIGTLSLLEDNIAAALERALLKRKRASRITQPLAPLAPPLDWKTTAQAVPLKEREVKQVNESQQPDKGDVALSELDPVTQVEPTFPPEAAKEDKTLDPSENQEFLTDANFISTPNKIEEPGEASPVSRFDTTSNEVGKTLSSNTHDIAHSHNAMSHLDQSQVSDSANGTTESEAAEAELHPGIQDPKGTLVSKYSRAVLPPDDGWQSPTPAPVRTKPRIERTDYNAVVDDLIESKLNTIQKLKEGGEAAIGALVMRFPGPVDENFAPTDHPAQAGPILAALIEIGQQAVPFITVRTADESPTIRRFATLLLGKIPCQESARAIARRLHDSSETVRAAAEISAQRLMGNVLAARALSAQLEQMARDKKLPLPERLRAIDTIAQLGRIEAIPTLLSLLTEQAPLSTSVVSALTSLTCHEYGNDLGAWQKFWQTNRNRSRSAWLVDAMLNDDSAIRVRASETLRPLVDSLHGYDPMTTESERLLAVELLRREIV